jgi:hypothetical protein
MRKRGALLMAGAIPTIAGAAVAALPDRALGLPDWSGWIALIPGLALLAAALPRRITQPLSILLLVAGGTMVCQPWSADLYRYSMALLLVAVVIFTVSSHLPEESTVLSSRALQMRAVGRAALFLGVILSLQPYSDLLFAGGLFAAASGALLTMATSFSAGGSAAPP